MMRFVCLLALCFCVHCSTPAEDPASKPPEADGSDPARDAWVLPDLMGGIYERQCAVCHGSAGEGITGCSLNNEVFLRTVSDGFLRQSIVEGRPNTDMAGYAGALTDEEIDSLVVHIRSFAQ